MNDDYIHRINKVLQYIDDHLDSELSLQQVAEIAYYSPFHLHRIFKAVTNETLNAYVTRKRIEKSALLLVHRRELPIAEIAQKFGFKSDSVFSRTFKKIYNQSPSEFRKNHQNNFGKISKPKSKNDQQRFLTDDYICNINRLKDWIKMNAKKIEVKELPARQLIYLSQIGEQGIESTFEKVLNWAIPNQVLQNSEANICRVFHDSFKTTDANKVRMSIGVAGLDEIKPASGFLKSIIKSGKYLTARFEIGLNDFEVAWNGFFVWMNTNGYKKADGDPFECYHSFSKVEGQQQYVVDFCIPVE